MTSQATSDEAGVPASIGHLVTSIKEDLTGLVRDEIELAKAELKQDAQAAMIGAAMAAVAGIVAFIGLILASFSLVYAFVALGLSHGWSFLVAAGCCLLVTAGLLLIAKGRFGRMTNIAHTKDAARGAAGVFRAARRRS
jgi:protein-S-isoprenylcysteine O-methyltransferase Ste14